MGCFSECVSYANIKGTFRIYQGNIFLTINNPRNDLVVSLTLNPMQVSILGRAMLKSTADVRIQDLEGKHIFGDMEIEFMEEKKCNVNNEPAA